MGQFYEGYILVKTLSGTSSLHLQATSLNDQQQFF